MDRLKSAEVFVRVVEKGSIAAAAEATDMSAMVAKHLKAIEARLQVRLFNRTTRRQALTEAGQTYFVSCKRLLEQFEEAESGVAALRGHPTGTLRLFSQVTFGAHRLAPLLADFVARYPEVKVDLTLNDRFVDLIEGGYDAAILIGRIEDSPYVVRSLPPYKMAMGAAPSYLASQGTPMRPEELSRHNCLAFSHWDRTDAWHLIGPTGEHFVPVEGNLRINHGKALMQAAIAGTGIVLQPEIIMEDAFAAGQLVPVLPEYAPPSRPKSLIYHPDRYLTPKLKSFVTFFLETTCPS